MNTCALHAHRWNQLLALILRREKRESREIGKWDLVGNVGLRGFFDDMWSDDAPNEKVGSGCGMPSGREGAALPDVDFRRF
jgi:hypothetical protein